MESSLKQQLGLSCSATNEFCAYPLTEFVPDSNGGEVPEESDAPVVIDSVPHWEDPEYDEEDRIREIDDFRDITLGRGSVDESVSQQQKDPDMRRIMILQDLDDPIITEEGEEITLTTGDIEFCASIIADTLIAAGIAEAADL